MTDTTETRFRRELNSFFAVTLLNVIFAAQAIGIGIAYVAAAFDTSSALPSPVLRAIAGALALVCFGLGLAWLRSSAAVLRGVTLIRRPFRRRRGPASEEELTRGIVEMVAHYRENRRTIRTMVAVGIVGGLFFLAQGVISALELVVGPFAGDSAVPGALAASAVLAAGLGMAGLLSSYYFSRFSRAWDLRLEETGRAEERLKTAMGIDGE